MNDNISERWGADIPLSVTETEDGAVSAKITVSNEDGDFVYSKTALFVDDEADLTIPAADSAAYLSVGDFSYLITVTYDDGAVAKYPDTEGCTDCELPTLTICEANDVEVS